MTASISRWKPGVMVLETVHREEVLGGDWSRLRERMAALRASGEFDEVSYRRQTLKHPTRFALVIYGKKARAAKVQRRGTCQLCGGLFALDKVGRISLHGYKRPRWGQIVGRCHGSNHPPAEVDLTLTREKIATLGSQLPLLRAALHLRGVVASEGSTEYTAVFRSSTREEQDLTHRQLSLYHGTRDWLRHLIEAVLPQFGKPATEVAR